MKAEEVVNFVTKSAKEILEKLEFDAEISVELVETEEGKKYIKVGITGDDLGLLIGFQGATMKALEQILDLLTSRALKNNSSEDRYKVIVDVNDYKEKQEKNIRETAIRAIGQARESGQPIELPSMNPAERRVVHMTVQEEDGVESESQGEEGERRVLIKPE